MEKNRDKLNYGSDFINKYFSALINDQQFLIKCLHLVKQEYFQNKAERWFLKMMFNYYQKYSTLITIDVIKVQIQLLKDELFKKAVINLLSNIVSQLQSSDLEYVKDRLISFCKFQQLKSAILDSVQLLKIQNYSKISDTIQKAMMAGNQYNVGSQYVDNLQQRYMQLTRNVVPTPWVPINNLLRGGLSAGQLGVFIAPVNVGKTWLLSNTVVSAMKAGKNVIFYTLQMSQQQAGSRIDVLFLQKQVDVLFNKESQRNILKEKIQKYKNHLIIKSYMPGVCTINDLRNHIKMCELFKKFKADLIVVDYGDIMKKQNNNSNSYFSYGDVYTGLKALAKELKLPIWTGSQTNRGGVDKQIVRSTDVAHSFGKIQIADFILTLSQLDQDQTQKTGRFSVQKNRGGKKGGRFNAQIQISIGRFEIFQQSSKKSMQLKNKMQNFDETRRMNIAKRIKQLKYIKEQEQEKKYE